jgi:hypothetical protein
MKQATKITMMGKQHQFAMFAFLMITTAVSSGYAKPKDGFLGQSQNLHPLAKLEQNRFREKVLNAEQNGWVVGEVSSSRATVFEPSNGESKGLIHHFETTPEGKAIVADVPAQLGDGMIPVKFVYRDGTGAFKLKGKLDQDDSIIRVDEVLKPIQNGQGQVMMVPTARHHDVLDKATGIEKGNSYFVDSENGNLTIVSSTDKYYWDGSSVHRIDESSTIPNLSHKNGQPRSYPISFSMIQDDNTITIQYSDGWFREFRKVNKDGKPTWVLSHEDIEVRFLNGHRGTLKTYQPYGVILQEGESFANLGGARKKVNNFK